MTRYNAPSLLTPPREEEEIYPYRRVWFSIVLEFSLLFAMALGVYILSNILGFTMPTRLQPLLNLTIALSPAVLWLVFSRLRENFVPEPRPQMTTVFILSLLVSNAISVPLMEIFAPQLWLSEAETVDRLIGYSLSAGIIHEISKYIVLRYTVWDQHFRIRLDAVAYGAASAVGYVTIWNLYIALDQRISPDLVGGRVFTNTTSQVIASIVLAYGLSIVRFNRKNLFTLPITLLAASLIHGLSISLRTGGIRAGFVLGTAAGRPLLGLILSAVLAFAVLVIITFLFSTAERRESQAVASRSV